METGTNPNDPRKHQLAHERREEQLDAHASADAEAEESPGETDTETYSRRERITPQSLSI